MIQEKEEGQSEQLQQLYEKTKYLQQENSQLKDEIQKLDEELFSLEYIKDHAAQMEQEKQKVTQHSTIPVAAQASRRTQGRTQGSQERLGQRPEPVPEAQRRVPVRSRQTPPPAQ